MLSQRVSMAFLPLPFFLHWLFFLSFPQGICCCTSFVNLGRTCCLPYFVRTCTIRVPHVRDGFIIANVGIARLARPLPPMPNHQTPPNKPPLPRYPKASALGLIACHRIGLQPVGYALPETTSKIPVNPQPPPNHTIQTTSPAHIYPTQYPKIEPATPLF